MTNTPVAATTTGITSATDRQMTVIATAYATSCDGESPTYCRFVVNEIFANQLRHLQRVLQDNHLSELRVNGGPDRWGPGDVADEMRFNLAELVMTTGVFWFADSPKHTDYRINSCMIPIQSVLDALARGEQQLLVGITDREQLLATVAEDEAQDAAEAAPVVTVA